MATAPHTTIDRPRTEASPREGHAAPTATAGRRPGKVVAALILGIVSIPAALIPILGLVLGVVAVVLAANGRSDIRRNRLEGSSQATAAIVLGSIGIALSLGLWIAGAIAAS